MLDHETDSSTACRSRCVALGAEFRPIGRQGILRRRFGGEYLGTAGRNAKVTRSGLPAGGMPRSDRGGDRSEGLGHPAKRGLPGGGEALQQTPDEFRSRYYANFASTPGQTLFSGGTHLRSHAADLAETFMAAEALGGVR